VSRSVAELAATLRGWRFTAVSESELHQGIARALTEGDWTFEHEVTLSPRDRIDFLVEGAIGVEVKVKGGRRAVEDQLARYAEHDRLRAIVLVTTRVQLTAVSPVLATKPVHTIYLPTALA
jgi:hypothetical protein